MTYSKPKITFVINYFYPDLASTGQLMTDLCLALQRDFDITVIAAQPNYAGEKIESKQTFEEDYVENIKVIRIKVPEVNKSSKWSRMRYILSYFMLATISLLKEKDTHIIYTISQPPILGGMIGSIGKLFKRAKHVYGVQDFNPEQAQAVAYTDKQFVFKIAKKLDNFNCRYADHVVLVGHDMVATLKNRLHNKNIPSYSVINNWTNEKEIIPLPKSNELITAFLNQHHLTDKFVVMYSGNIGLFYDLENIISICKQFENEPQIVFLFIGEGAIKLTLQKYVEEHNLNNVRFLPYQSLAFLKYSLNVADVHLVVNQKGIKGVSVPSKIYGVMAVGKPILGVLEQGSEAQMLIDSSQSGIVVEPQDYDGIVKAIQCLYKMNEDERKKMGLNGRKYLQEHLTKEKSINSYRNLLKELSRFNTVGETKEV